MVNMGAEKMSKSLGNTLWIREILKRHDADAVRFWLLGTLGLHEPKPALAEIPRELSEQIVSLIRARAAARAGRDWSRADELRGELARLEVTVKDTPQGTDWEWKGLRATEKL